MNIQPHIHKVEIVDEGYYWQISYGDQRIYPDKPNLFPRHREAKLLRKHIERVIRKHDEATLRAARSAESIARSRRLIPQLQDGRWGSEQLKEVKR